MHNVVMLVNYCVLVFKWVIGVFRETVVVIGYYGEVNLQF